ncbi:MAG TPA: PLP-dependent aminotransferase family protein [Steroidobacteraceae bacterium]
MNLHASPIREILSVAQRPGMVSFAGGLPAPETFPAFSPASFPADMLQYGSSEGEFELRKHIAQDLEEIGLSCSPDQILILSGSQQGIDLVAKLFVDPGTQVAVESPTYLAALQVFRFFGAEFQCLDPELPGSPWPIAQRPSFAYIIPTFQNPTGRCYSSDERDAFAQACDAQYVTLFEDDPYRDLVYNTCDRRPVCARLRRASWIYQGSFSKSLAPGLRLGYLAASVDLMAYLMRLKQAADLHSSRLSQWLVLEQLRDPGRIARLAGLVNIYRQKRDFFAAALERYMGKRATWEIPPGGLFFWLTLASPIDTRNLLPRAIERGVAFMPGEPFYPDPEQNFGTLRLSFSHTDEQQTERGLAILAALLQ